MKTLIPELLTKILCDPLPDNTVDAAYLYGQTIENQSSVLNKGASLYKKGLVRSIWIADSQPKSGYLGFTVWQEKLIALGVPDSAIVGVPIDSYEIINTYIEASEVARLALSMSIKSLIVVSSPFHQLRAFVTIVTAISREYPELKAYNQTGEALEWYESVSHSQGELKGTREGFIYTELDRIDLYHGKGFLVSLDEVKDYLLKR